MENEALKNGTETSMRIASLIGSGTTHDLPELYDLILDNMEIATKEEISILLKAMGKPKSLTKAQLEKRDIHRHLSVSLAFSSSTQTNLDFKSNRAEIFKWAEQLQPQEKNGTEQVIKDLFKREEYEDLYKKVHRLFFAKSEKHHPKPLSEFKPD